MPEKYHLDTKPTPNLHLAPSPTSLLDWEEGCLKCAVCVKTQCVYGVYSSRRIDDETLFENLDSLCKSCLSCVQNCPRRLITKTVSPEFLRLGDEYWTPDILRRIYYQAESGKIPVSGAGYGGPFSGPGFDSMWTDMSEIVRPTRDGIHGREYINTSVDLGRKPDFIEFPRAGGEIQIERNYVESPMPFILGIPGDKRISENICRGLALAAVGMKAFLLLPAQCLTWLSPDMDDYVIPSLTEETLRPDVSFYRRFKIVEITWWDGLLKWLEVFKTINRQTVVSIRLPFSKELPGIIEPLVKAGADIIHLTATNQGRRPEDDRADPKAPLLRDLIREVHLQLVDLACRDRITLLVSGGLAMAEHAAKAIVCGADAVCLDLALWAAMECRVCRDCLDKKDCPVSLESVYDKWAKQRIINLVGAWRNQLLEVLGAMGLREIRRLRGEVGRAMFFEQLEKESFAPIFGRRKV